MAKANSRARVHRRAYMDYVGVKLRDAEGRLTGELRIVGLFASSAYTQPLVAIPYLRAKAATVTERLGFAPGSHSGKALAVALETYSRDEMFQIEVDLLERFVGVVTELGERPRIRVLPRVDRFDRFVSVLVFVPRERYDARLRDEIGVLLATRYDGHVSAYYPNFPEGTLATIHFIIGRTGGPTPEPDVDALEAEIAAIARDWSLAFERAAARTGRIGEFTALAPAFPAATATRWTRRKRWRTPPASWSCARRARSASTSTPARATRRARCASRSSTSRRRCPCRAGCRSSRTWASRRSPSRRTRSCAPTAPMSGSTTWS